MNRYLFLLLFALLGFSSKASHVMGGELNWRCSGNGYIFQLIFYRDCNGVDVNPVSETIKVWNHPALTSIPVLFVSRTDISPSCTEIPGGPEALHCGSGSHGGNGVGAIEKVIYESNPIVLPGVPPSQGWIFTYSNFSRNSSVTNLVNPTNVGVTITAKMFPFPGMSASVCRDNSARFLQDPYLAVCAGEYYEYNLHPVDVDLDSVVTLLAAPIDRIIGSTYNPPIDPVTLPFNVGYSATNPTPDINFDPGNIPTTLDPQTGQIAFLSNTTGGFVVKVRAQSYRNGLLIAEMEREMELVVTPCTNTNNAPTIPGPFAGLYETTLIAGTLVNFTLQVNDPEVLQDGTPQTVFLSASGSQYGANFTNPASGCDVAPCATLSSTPIITGTQGATVNFAWQTDCDHLVDAQGNTDDEKTFTFVFKAQDNYCQVPKTNYKTISIHLKNPGLIPATPITCISSQTNGDIDITWNVFANPNGTFVNAGLHSLEDGLIANFPVGSTTTTLPNPGVAKNYFFLIQSGCNVIKSSDTVRNVHLDVLNPANGTAVLDWNTPANNPPPGMANTCTILREYPAGVWTTIATLPYATVHYVDTITICNAQLNYQVVYSTPTCSWSSNIVGGVFQDKITPFMPVIAAVSVDTISGNVVITWNQNQAPDTYGYIIYHKDQNGFIIEIDTVWGIGNTSYTHPINVTGPETYSIAAFDSCFTPSIPPTRQTSAKADLNTSMFLTYSLNSCSSVASLTWTPYVGWGTSLVDYSIFVKHNGAWTLVGNSATTSYDLPCIPLDPYCVTIRANRSNGVVAFSNIQCFSIQAPAPPATHYLRVATVDAENIEIRHQITAGTNVQAVRFQKYNPNTSQFELLVELPVNAPMISYVDTDVDVSSFSYTYRAVVVDSCGNEGAISNITRTVLLKVKADQTRLTTYLDWSTYGDFAGGVLQYQVFRGIDGVFPSTPYAIVSPTHRFYQDSVEELGFEHTGKVCYYVIAEEAPNQYGFQEYSLSNEACVVIEPWVYCPNAFTPGGINPIFIPVITFQDVTKYELSVLDRWGQLVFQSRDYTVGWDGKHMSSNKLVEPNTYVYVLKVVDGNNQEYFYRGSVTVVR
jgi:gliding motility-associated-like protein